MSWEKKKEELGRDTLIRLYEGGFVESIFNAREEKFRNEGWTLKDGSWSPWYLNLRPIGDAPDLLADMGYALALMFEEEMPDCNKILGVDMAGIPIATATSIVSYERRKVKLPFCYTRPLPTKVRKVEEAKKILEKLKEENIYKKWGGHQLIEGRLYSGDNISIWDDMVTSLGSKQIAKEILFYEVNRLNELDFNLENIVCDHVGVILDREQGAYEAAKGVGMNLSALIPFKTKGLYWLKDVMHPREHELISDFQNDPQKYKDKEFQKEVIEIAKRTKL